MPRAVQGELCSTYNGITCLTYAKGVLVECDPSIKAIIQRINDQYNHDFIIEDIDDEHMLIKKDKQDELKLLLKEVQLLLR